MTFPCYATYRDTDVGWLGNIPSHWELDRLKHSFERVQRPYSEDAETVTAFRDGVVTRRSNRRTDGFTEADKYIGYQGIEQGDLAIHAMDGFAGAIGVADSSGKCSPVVSVCRAKGGAEPQYYAHVLRHIAKSGYLTAIAKGIRERSTDFRWNDARDIPVPMPPSHEQREILAVLDRETAKIDALIAKQEQLIATLREDRTATITHAVTKGLDPDAEMKDSGVEWLGSIPAHWKQAQLRRLLRRIEQGVSPAAYAEMADEGWGVLKSGCVNGGIFRDTQHKKLPGGFQIDPSIVVHSGDLLVCRASGSPDLVGSAAIVRDLGYRLILSDKTFRLIPDLSILPDYLEWMLNSRIYREQVRGAISGAEGLANNLPMSSLKSFSFPIPPLAEQHLIVEMLRTRSAVLDGLIAKAVEVIATLREYRSALITDAVTGKIDVRGAA